MPLCIGRRACERARCKQRGKSLFPGKPDLERAFIKGCGSNSGLTKEEFLCSGNYIDEADFIVQYGTDPCAGGATVEGTLDPFNSREREAQEWKDIQPVLLGLGILIAASLVILYLIKS